MLKFLALCTIFIVGYTNGSPHGIEYLKSLSIEEINTIPAAIIEDSLLNCSQLIQKYGYPVEIHEIQTEDGYLLTVHRIPGGKLESRRRGRAENRIPVLIMHGLLSSSVDFIVDGPGKGLGYLLADAGYDVWMGNARGNFYSKKHITMSPKDTEFWKFSWNEIGLHDLPAMINHILDTTGHSKLHYIGHSQGTTAFFVMASEKPEMNDKILSMQALGPAAYMSNAISPILTQLAPYVNTIEKLLDLLGIGEFWPLTEFQATLVNAMCGEESKYTPVCTNLMFLLCGYNPDQLNVTMIPVYLSHTPAGAASRQIIHYAQEYVSTKFRKFDYGTQKNLEIYDSEYPPNYDLSLITAPVALHYSDNDWLVSPIDVDRLHNELGNSLGKFRVPMDEFNHLDFLWAIDVKTLLYDDMMALMENYNE